MSSQRTRRRALSLGLVLAVVFWTEAGIAIVPTPEHGAQCHMRMPGAHQQAMHSAKQEGGQAQAAACCPMHVALQMSSGETQLPCCADSRQSTRPQEFLVASGKSLPGQLSAAANANGRLIPPRQRSAFVSIAESPPFVPSVFDRKTDLRI